MGEFFKNNKWKLVVSSVIILLPAVFGLIMWDSLPEIMATHFGVEGQADGFSSKGFAVFGLPLIMLALHWLCVFVTSFDKGNRGQSGKVFSLVLFIVPVISVYASAAIYASALGFTFDIASVSIMLVGLVFVVVGNYLPKCKQNRTIGIKLPWTLSNEENWNKTHRFAGRLWLVGGFLIMPIAFLPSIAKVIALFTATMVLIAVPCVYSWKIHR